MDFLSTQWFDALNTALQSIDPSPTPEVRLGIGQIVTGAPQGDVSYVVAVGANVPAIVEVGSTKGAQVTIITDYATASAIAQGTSTAELLYEGRIKVRGDAKALLGAQDALSEFRSALAQLAVSTEF